MWAQQCGPLQRARQRADQHVPPLTQDLSISNDVNDEGDDGDEARSTAADSDAASTVPSPRTVKLKRLGRDKLIIIMVGLPGRGKTFL